MQAFEDFNHLAFERVRQAIIKLRGDARRKMRQAQRRRYGTGPTTPTGREIACEILKKHHETLKEDPECLSTEFMQKLIGIDCDKL